MNDAAALQAVPAFLAGGEIGRLVRAHNLAPDRR